MDPRSILSAARGDEPADLLLRGGRLVNVLSGEIETTDVAVAGGLVVGLGDGYEAAEVVDLDGRFLCPGLIDAHVHVESSMVPPSEFARAVLPHGVTAVVSDPHEIANVLGMAGIRFMLDDGRRSPLAVYANASSCVPATHLETSGATLTAADLAPLLDEPDVPGLAEVMNYPGTVAGDPGVLEKIRLFRGRPIDGHCPGLGGPALNAYVAAGIQSDHECTTAAEARAKLERGLRIFMREGTAARNLRALLPIVTPRSERRISLCTDDRHLTDLLDEGSIDHLVRVCIGEGVDPVTAIRMATINTAEHFGLDDRGAVAPGRWADLVVVGALDDFRAERVYAAGRLVAADGRMLVERGAGAAVPASTMNVDWDRVSLRVPAAGTRIRVIGAVPDQLVTEHLEMDGRVEDGGLVADPDRDLLKIAVIERHRASGRTGLGFVARVGLRRGAIAGTVAHDHHNLIVIGADDESMLAAARAVAETGGGLAAADGDRVLARLPLPIGGLMSNEPHEDVAAGLRAVVEAARTLGSTGHDPFMTMSFLGLEVIPSLKLTDIGLVDVDRMEPVGLFPDS